MLGLSPTSIIRKSTPDLHRRNSVSTTLEDQNNNAGLQLRILNAMVEQERLVDDGIGDELMEMQEILWPIKRLRAKDFAIRHAI